MNPDQFQCEQCHGIFDKELTDKEAEDQAEKEFSGLQIPEAALICDDCCKLIFN